MSITLILGGTKSGKSRLAEQWAQASAKPVIYVATAQSHDAEMHERITRHQQQRPSHWQTVEEPLQLAAVITAQAQTENCVLIDCLTLWLTNLLLAEQDQLLQQKQALLACLTQSQGDIILVSNETNMGIMPLGELTRRYCDEAGLLHQQIAAISDNVVLTVAGLPHLLKGKIYDGF